MNKTNRVPEMSLANLQNMSIYNSSGKYGLSIRSFLKHLLLLQNHLSAQYFVPLKMPWLIGTAWAVL